MRLMTGQDSGAASWQTKVDGAKLCPSSIDGTGAANTTQDGEDGRQDQRTVEAVGLIG